MVTWATNVEDLMLWRQQCANIFVDILFSSTIFLLCLSLNFMFALLSFINIKEMTTTLKGLVHFTFIFLILSFFSLSFYCKPFRLIKCKWSSERSKQKAQLREWQTSYIFECIALFGTIFINKNFLLFFPNIPELFPVREMVCVCLFFNIFLEMAWTFGRFGWLISAH